MKMKRYYFQTQETVTTTRKGYIEIDLDFTQIYDCFEEVSEKISSIGSMRLLMYLLREMNDNNYIKVDSVLLLRYNTYRSNKGMTPIPDSTFYNCVKDLVGARALTRVTRGSYYLNPHFFWKDSPEKRREFIESETQDRRLIPIDMKNLGGLDKE